MFPGPENAFPLRQGEKNTTVSSSSIYFGDNSAQKGHGRKSLRSGIASVWARGTNAVVQIVSAIILARLLTPMDYGLVSMVMAFVGIAPLLVDLGTRDALLQQQNITSSEVSALFWITALIGGGFAALVAASGPLIAHFYHEPRLEAIAVVSAASVLIGALTCQHQALMRRAMMFQWLAIFDVCANVFGASVAVAMALKGYGYWALAVRPVATNLVVAVAIWIFCGWRPGKPTLTSGVRDMIKFGVHFIGFSSADFVGRFGDRIAIGYTQGAWNLGYYQKAVLVYDNVLDLTTPLHAVAMTGLSKLRDNVEELKRSWAIALSTVTFFAMPAFGLMAASGRDLVILLLGDKWRNAGILVGILALRGIPHVVERTVGWLHVAAGRADRCMRWGLVAAGAQIAALFIGLPFGLRGVAIAYVVCTFVLFLPAISYSGRSWGIGARDVLNVVGRQMIGTLSSTGIAVLAGHLVPDDTERLARMILVGLTFIISYFITVVGLLDVKSPLKVAHFVCRDFLGKQPNWSFRDA